ncbi:MAG TPA: TonB-dependent receptor, partial [Candidatus Kapabacteria bacterium]|nr:TonB-dependent receptor [Candidatus Kapabacteria bacterium]
MQKIFIFILFFIASTSFAQHIISGEVTDATTHQPLIGAIVRVASSSLGAKTDTAGRYIIKQVTGDSCVLRFTYLGYKPLEITVGFHELDTAVVSVELEAEELEGEEVVITGTRTLRTIADVPVRVEAIPIEEVEEKIMMRAANVSMLLSETPGLRVQTTSATSNSSNLRIWGLPGRYTQILTDGIPNLGGLSSGFSITQFPPLNIRQVEIIKGASSVLYGADAIGGVVNFLTKEPRENESFSALVNASTEGAQDIAAYYTNGTAPEDNESIRGSVFASYNRQALHDVNHDNMSDLAAYDRINIAPQLALDLSERFQLKVSGGYVYEVRRGGVVDAQDSAIGKAAPYIEKNTTNRYYYITTANWRSGEHSALTVNVGDMSLNREAQYGAVPFDGSQNDFIADVQFTLDEPEHSLLFGAGFKSNRFDDKTERTTASLDYSYTIPSLLAQDEWALSEQFKILAGVRGDFHSELGSFVTPRLSFFYKPVPELTMRLSSGTSFKAPTIFVEEAEETGYKDIRGFSTLIAERATSVSYDVNWKTLINNSLGLSINTALFMTKLDHALSVNEDSIDNGIVILENVTGPTISRGLEFTTQLTYSD